MFSALGSESDDTGSSPGRGVREKIKRAPLLGLAKFIYHTSFLPNSILSSSEFLSNRLCEILHFKYIEELFICFSSFLI